MTDTPSPNVHLQGVQFKSTPFQPLAAGLEFWYFTPKTGVKGAEVSKFEKLLPNSRILIGKVDFGINQSFGE